MRPVQDPRRHVGVIGLGPMGTALAASLLAEGFGVCCHDIRPGAAEPVLSRGAVWAADARTVARWRCRLHDEAAQPHVKYAWYLASAEALVLARQLGLDPDVTASAIERPT